MSLAQKKQLKDSSKMVLYPRQFNRLVELGYIQSNYIIDVNLSSEKDKLYREIQELKSKIERMTNSYELPTDGC